MPNCCRLRLLVDAKLFWWYSEKVIAWRTEERVGEKERVEKYLQMKNDAAEKGKSCRSEKFDKFSCNVYDECITCSSSDTLGGLAA